MRTEPISVVNEFLNAVKSLDLAKIADLLDEKVQWTQPGDNQISGPKDSKEMVFSMVGKMFELSHNTIQLTGFDTVCVNDERIAAVLSWSATKPSGDRLTVINIDVYTVAWGKIVRVEVFSADQAQEDQFWKS